PARGAPGGRGRAQLRARLSASRVGSPPIKIKWIDGDPENFPTRFQHALRLHHAPALESANPRPSVESTGLTCGFVALPTRWSARRELHHEGPFPTHRRSVHRLVDTKKFPRKFRPS